MTTSFIAPRQKLFGHLDRLQELRATGKTTAPVNVEIDLSNRCSLGCQWCHFAYTHTRGPLAGHVKPEGAVSGGDLMDYDLATSILDQLDAAEVRSVVWAGGGEPTLHPRFDDVITYCNLDQGLYTHGGHIDDKRAALLKRRLTWAYVSLDECDAVAYQTSKGVDRFDAVLTNIARLVAADGPATIGVGCLLHVGNWQNIHRMVRLGRELGVDYVQFRPVIEYDMTAPGSIDGDVDWIDSAIGHLGAYRDDPFVMADVERFKRYRQWAGHGYQTCYWSAMQTVITPNGKVWRCINKREHGDACLGDLTIDTFADIWKRTGGSCAVDGHCRVACRGDQSNLALEPIMADYLHPNFV